MKNTPQVKDLSEVLNLKPRKPRTQEEDIQATQDYMLIQSLMKSGLPMVIKKKTLRIGDYFFGRGRLSRVLAKYPDESLKQKMLKKDKYNDACRQRAKEKILKKILLAQKELDEAA